MPSSINTGAPADTTLTAATPACVATASDAAAADAGKPAVIASRRRCEADGVGLSHYILMDRKAGQ